MQYRLAPRQVLSNVVERLIISYQWIDELNEEHNKGGANGKNVSNISDRLRILCDAFATYMTSLFSGGGQCGKYKLKLDYPQLYKK